MNKPTQNHNSIRCGRLAVLLLAILLSIPVLRAQPTEGYGAEPFPVHFRHVQVMKPRIDAVQKCLNTMLATSMRGQLHSGDSMAVWTFGQTLQTKGLPLQSWNADVAASIASNLVKFVGDQRYAKSSRLDALQPALNRVVQDSERLTVVIFCDGESKISGTPYDDAINQVFKEKSAEQKQAGEPLVIFAPFATWPLCRLHREPAAATGEHLGVPAFAVATTTNVSTKANQSGTSRASGGWPAAHHHRQKTTGQPASASDQPGSSGGTDCVDNADQSAGSDQRTRADNQSGRSTND